MVGPESAIVEFAACRCLVGSARGRDSGSGARIRRSEEKNVSRLFPHEELPKRMSLSGEFPSVVFDSSPIVSVFELEHVVGRVLTSMSIPFHCIRNFEKRFCRNEITVWNVQQSWCDFVESKLSTGIQLKFVNWNPPLSDIRSRSSSYVALSVPTFWW